MKQQGHRSLPYSCLVLYFTVRLPVGWHGVQVLLQVLAISDAV
jgi:hypothetical protein